MPDLHAIAKSFAAVEVASVSDPSAADADGWLEIGDPTLRRFLAPSASSAFSPSQGWAARTGLPLAFAVWIVRAGVALRQGQIETFARAWARGAARIEALASEASRAWKPSAPKTILVATIGWVAWEIARGAIGR